MSNNQKVKIEVLRDVVVKDNYSGKTRRWFEVVIFADQRSDRLHYCQNGRMAFNPSLFIVDLHHDCHYGEGNQYVKAMKAFNDDHDRLIDWVNLAYEKIMEADNIYITPEELNLTIQY